MAIVWLALTVSLVLVIGSAVYLTRHGLAAFRALKALGGGVEQELNRIDVATREIELHLNAAADSGTKLNESLQRLQASRARLNVLLAAIAEVRAAVARVTGVVPGK
jgi:hypothetical protein